MGVTGEHGVMSVSSDYYYAFKLVHCIHYSSCNLRLMKYVVTVNLYYMAIALQAFSGNT